MARERNFLGLTLPTKGKRKNPAADSWRGVGESSPAFAVDDTLTPS